MTMEGKEEGGRVGGGGCGEATLQRTPNGDAR